MSSVKCLSCGAKVEIDFKPLRGDFVECDECGTEYEIVSISPLKIDWVEFDDSEEDYEDFDDDE